MRVEIIQYPMGALAAEAALIYDDNVSVRRPVVLLAPNWMGVTDSDRNAFDGEMDAAGAKWQVVVFSGVAQPISTKARTSLGLPPGHERRRGKATR